MNSASFAPNSSCATSQGSRSSGAPTRDGSGIGAVGTAALAAATAVAASAAPLSGSFASGRAVNLIHLERGQTLRAGDALGRAELLTGEK